MKQVGAEIFPVSIPDDGIDSLRHHDVISLENTEITVAPSGIGRNPAVGRDIEFRPYMEFVLLSVYHDDMTGGDSFCAKEGNENGRIIAAVAGHGLHEAADGVEARIHVPIGHVRIGPPKTLPGIVDDSVGKGP